MMAYTEENVSAPVVEMACRIPMVADELCSRKATPAPSRKPSTGLSESWKNILAKVSDSDSGLTAAVMLRRPVKRMPKPIVIEPTVSDLRPLTAMMKRIPMIDASGASVEGLKKFRSDVSDAFTSSSRMIWPVTVVPTFAPRMTPMDWCSDKIPAPTRPDVSTMVAVEL